MSDNGNSGSNRSADRLRWLVGRATDHLVRSTVAVRDPRETCRSPFSGSDPRRLSSAQCGWSQNPRVEWPCRSSIVWQGEMDLNIGPTWPDAMAATWLYWCALFKALFSLSDSGVGQYASARSGAANDPTTAIRALLNGFERTFRYWGWGLSWQTARSVSRAGKGEV